MKPNPNQQELPWLVELLFVQIGLPDSWLRSFLKTKKKSKLFFKDNQKTIGYSLVLLAGFVYIQPVVRNARLENICVESSIKYVKDNVPYKSMVFKNSSQAWAYRFCNGGMILE